MAENGILGGLSTQALNSDGPIDAQCETDHVILVTATERRTKADIDHYVKTLTKAIN
jgi:hypothetical protein